MHLHLHLSFLSFYFYFYCYFYFYFGGRFCHVLLPSDQMDGRTGCVVIPVPLHGAGRTNIHQQSLALENGILSLWEYGGDIKVCSPLALALGGLCRMAFGIAIWHVAG